MRVEITMRERHIRVYGTMGRGVYAIMTGDP